MINVGFHYWPLQYFSAHSEEGSSTTFLNHHYIVSLVLGPKVPHGKQGSNMAKERLRFSFEQTWPESYILFCGISEQNIWCLIM